MHRHYRAFVLTLGVCFVIALPGSAATDETAHTAAAIIAVDDHWSQAEIHGDTAYLDRLLLADYHSVSAHGRAIGKADILQHARLDGSSHIMQQKILQYMQTHPFAECVVLHGNTAVLTFYSPKLGPRRGIWLANVFVFQKGAWHALYSQHTEAPR